MIKGWTREDVLLAERQALKAHEDPVKVIAKRLLIGTGQAKRLLDDAKRSHTGENN